MGTPASSLSSLLLLLLLLLLDLSADASSS
jgi:hypothetical protein